MDNNMVDITDFFERSPNDKRSPRPKQTTTTHLTTQGYCPTPQRQSLHTCTNEFHSSSSITCQATQKQNPGDPPGQKKSTPMDGQHVLEDSHSG